MPSSSSIPVVCVLIEKEGAVLIAQRPAHKHLGLAWEFPGGKVEAGEPPAHALAREIQEELGCTLFLMHALPTRRHVYETVSIEMTPFVARLAPGSPEPTAIEHVALAWVPVDRLGSYTLAPADLPVLVDYLQWKAGLRRPATTH